MQPYVLVALALLLPQTSLTGQSGAREPGLLGEYFRARPPAEDQMPSGKKPFFVRVDKQVDFASVDGEFYGSKIANNLFVQWTGFVRVATAGRYTFATTSDDGSRLYVGGKRVVDNWGPHGMERKAGTVELSAGDHALRITFSEGSGGAGCIATWIPPGGAEAPIPAAALVHDAPAARDALASWNKDRWQRAKARDEERPRRNAGAPFDKNRGPVVTTAVSLGKDERGENTVYRGIVIRLDDSAKHCVLFDADTLRMAAAWTDGSLTLKGLPFTEGHGAYPSVDGVPVFRLRATPGWAKDGELKDPRQGEYPPLGHLPKDWAHYKGLYLDGDRVVLKYTVGGAEVLETPSLRERRGGVSIVRSLRIQRDGRGMTMALADLPPGTAVEGTSATLGTGDETTTIRVAARTKGPTLRATDGLLVLDLPPGEGTTAFDVVYSRGAAAASKAPASVDFAALTNGGPARWPQVFTTKGEVAPAAMASKNAYVVDRLTVPYKNEYEPRMRIGGMAFFADGKRAAVSTWDGDVWIVSGIDDELENLQWKRFATGLHEPLGLEIVDDVVYTVDDMQITRLHDLDEDGEADFYENFNNDWELTSGFHAFCFDLQKGPTGDFFFAFGSPVRSGGRSFERMGEHHGSILRVSKDGKTLTRYATGLRAPNGICVSPTGQVTSGDNEGTFVPRCPIHWITEGSFCGVVDSAAVALRAKMATTATRQDRVPGGRAQIVDSDEMPKPLAWLPRSVDNSGGGQAWVTSDKWGPVQGSMLHMSYGTSSLFLVLQDPKGAQMQGGVVKIPVKFTSSAMRARFNPRDGQLYVAGLRGWQTNAVKDGGLDRVRYTGKPLALPVGLKTDKTGLELSFDEKIDPELANDPSSFAVRAADILWTQAYGSKEYKLGQRGSTGKRQEGWTDMKVTSSRLLADGKTVRVEIAGMQPVHEMEVSLDLETTGGTAIRTKVYCTVHVLE